MLYDSKRWDKKLPAAVKAPTTLRECKTAAEMIALAKTKPPHESYRDEFMVRNELLVGSQQNSRRRQHALHYDWRMR